MKFIYVMTVIFSLMICSCTDDFTYYNGDIPEGEGDLTATVTFTPTVATNLHATRTPGNVIHAIESLCVLVYTPDGELVQKYTKDDPDPKYKLEGYDDTKDYNVSAGDHLDGDEAHTDETTTAQATFSLPGLPYGRYKIYTVANMGNLDNYKDDIQTEEGLRNINLKWNENDIAANNQMFGYFTREDAKNADVSVLTFTPTNSKFHAWLNRVVSKVTIAFDASGLNQDVTIYIKNVTIRDIPSECLLGNTNTPTSAQLLNSLGSHYEKPDYTKPSEVKVKNTRFEYNSQGIITEEGISTGKAKTDGYKLENSLRQPVPEGAHATNAASLFFFENNQGDFGDLKDAKEKEKYNKQQKPSTAESDGVGTPIRDKEEDADGNITNDFKDRVPNGTYIEVEAYYISANPGKIGEGSIKYRFMLGKNVTYDYNAQRNYHFKLTLGFNGWANQPDWHIDYEQPEPGIEVQPEFRVSYLYGQKSELPIRILEGSDYTIESIEVNIVENNWAPYDPKTRGVPPTETDITPNPTYAFKWNRAAYESAPYMRNGKQVPYYGFLALHFPAESKKSEVVTDDYGLQSNIALERYYEDKKEGKRIFTEFSVNDEEHPQHSQPNTSTDDNYTVNPVLDDQGKQVEHQKTLMVPVWTRAKTLIRGSGFSGNNPYEGYERKAKLEIKATFKRNDGGEPHIAVEEVDVYQVKRLVNPKGVWRAANRNEAFHVTLLEAASGNDMADFRPFTSEGEWTAFIESNDNAGFYLTQNSETVGYQDETGVIHGYTGSEIHFDINFDKVTVSATEPECAIVKVLYHGNQCLHKILVRKGYDQPVEMGENTWSSFSLYQATPRGRLDENTGESISGEYDVELTRNPLMLGSMFRRGRLSKGIFVVNNIKDEGGVGPFEAPGTSYQFLVGRKNGDGWLRNTWTQIGYRDDRNQPNNTLGTFYEGDYTYRVPTYDDFKKLTDAAEFGYGVVYGSSATVPARTAEDAYGLIDPYNEGLFDDPRGMRGVIAYTKDTGNQIFFPMGKYGTGRRNNFIFDGNQAGELRYGDVDYLLASSLGTNLYRPIPYNLMVQSGNIYWIDQYTAADANHPELPNPCLGWDMNYFNFDFNPYTANNYRDACPIKFIIVK